MNDVFWELYKVKKRFENMAILSCFMRLEGFQRDQVTLLWLHFDLLKLVITLLDIKILES